MPIKDPSSLLKEARTAAKLSQGRAAALCGVTCATWNKWEGGSREIAPATFLGCLMLLGHDPKEATETARAMVEEAEAGKRAQAWERVKARREGKAGT